MDRGLETSPLPVFFSVFDLFDRVYLSVVKLLFLTLVPVLNRAMIAAYTAVYLALFVAPFHVV